MNNIMGMKFNPHHQYGDFQNFDSSVSCKEALSLYKSEQKSLIDSFIPAIYQKYIKWTVRKYSFVSKEERFAKFGLKDIKGYVAWKIGPIENKENK